MLRHALVVCGGWVAGVALQLQQAVLADPAIYAAVALAALPALWLAPRLRTGAQVLCLALALGALGAHARSAFGVAKIPMGACVEFEMIAEVAD